MYGTKERALEAWVPKDANVLAKIDRSDEAAVVYTSKGNLRMVHVFSLGITPTSEAWHVSCKIDERLDRLNPEGLKLPDPQEG